MTPRPNAQFGPSSWTVPFSTASSSACARRSACQQFAAALPARARVSEPVLPLVLAALHDELGARPDRAAARGRRRARRGRGGRLVPRATSASRCSRRAASTGARVSSRRRTSSASARARSRCSSAAGSSARRRPRSPRALPPRAARPAPLRSRPATSPGIDALAEQLALAGYERVERVEERGQFAVRGGLVDVFPTTGREPLRIELFGDEIEQIRAFSPFTQRALRQVDEATIYPAAERRRELVEIDLGPTRRGRARVEAPDDLVPRVRPRARPRLAARRGAGRLGGGGPTPVAARRRGRARPAAAGPAVLVRRAAARRSRRAGSPRPRTSSAALLRQELDVVVAFPHRGEALRQQAAAAPRRGARCSSRARRRPGSRSRSRPRGAASSGASSGSRCCPTRRSSASGRRARDARAGPRAAELLRPAHRRLRRPRGPRHRAAPRLRDEGGRRRHARLPAARLPRRRPRLRPARADRQGQPLHRRRLEGADALEARRQGVGQPEDPRPRAPPRDGGRAAAALRAAPDTARVSPTTSSTNGSSGSRRSSPTARPRTSGRRSRP